MYLVALVCGCYGNGNEEIIVFAALDKEFSAPILREFEQETGIQVLAKYDQESNKTVGLVTEIVQAARRPKGDIFWNNEILHTLRLERMGLLAQYRSPLADNYPSQFVSPEGYWHGFAARARVLIVNTEILPDSSTWPNSVEELADLRWKGRCGIAKPLFGTTASHAAVLFSLWGEDRAQEFFRQVHQNAVIEGGNKRVAVNVGRGQYAWGLTDTDDAIIEIEQGRPVVMIFPDQGPEASGTLLIPNTVAIINGGPHPDAARRLVDYVLRGETEERLAAAASAQIPLHRGVATTSRAVPEAMKIMDVDFHRAVDSWDHAQTFLRELFQ